MNILLQHNFSTPRGTAPFGKISVKDFEEAFEKGMQIEKEHIQEIVDNPETPTMENTILPETDRILSRASTLFFNLISACTSDEMDKLANRVSPLLAQHANEILHNEALFERVKHIHAHHRRLTQEEKKLLDNVYKGFVRNGACLSPEDKEKLNQLEMELSTLTLTFNHHMLSETNDFQLHLTKKEDLAGLPESVIEATRQNAQEKGKEGWTFTLHAPNYIPFLTYSDRRELRKKMYLAKNTICYKENENSNIALVPQIVNTRLKIARILGYDTYAQYMLERRMAGSVDNVYRLLQQLQEAYLPKARSEVEEVTALAKETEGEDFELMPWDFAYYAQKLKEKHYEIDMEVLRPYFSLPNVIEGVFSLASKLFGIEFVENPSIPVYHPDVKAYEVFDEDDSFLAVLYADFYPRENKQSGAWMTSYAEQYIDDEGTDHRPHVSITTNFTKPTAEKPSLLTLGEVETFLHEFGHALHGIFSKTRFKSLGGTNVYWDFVEFPSQFLENYATEEEFLHMFARHYKTGELLPHELIEKVKKSRNFLCGYHCIRQLSFCYLDLAYYDRQKPLDKDIKELEEEAWSSTQLLPSLPETCMSVQFGHIMSGGYSAGYYSYKWAEVLDADAFSIFQKHGLFNTKWARRLREEILSRGGTVEPMKLYENFCGHQPTIDALLRRNGIKE